MPYGRGTTPNGVHPSMTPQVTLGLGRGFRRTQSSLGLAQPKTLSPNLPESIDIKRNLIEENKEYLLDLITNMTKNEKMTSQKDVSEQFREFTGNSLREVALTLGFNTEAQMLRAIPAQKSRRVPNPIQPKILRQVRENLKQRSAKNDKRAKSIYIPLSRGERVTVRVDAETCWIPIDLLTKIYGFRKASIKPLCTHDATSAYEDSICYRCFHSLGEHLQKDLKEESKNIVFNLYRLLANNFRNQNGCELSPLPVVQ